MIANSYIEKSGLPEKQTGERLEKTKQQIAGEKKLHTAGKTVTQNLSSFSC
jgi:hypothetical protein